MRHVPHPNAALTAALLAQLALAPACSSPDPVITTCVAADGVEPHCGFQNPEDLALLPDGRTVIASQFGTMDGSTPGNIAVFDVETAVPRVAFAAGAADSAGDAGDAPWGDPACPGPPPESFAPHGLDLERRSDGRLELLVVNHGGREAIEFFEVLPDRLDTTITWRGCAVPPEDSYLNDVVHTPEGGFLTTHMMPKSREATSTWTAMLFGNDTGWVYEWRSPNEWKRLAGTDAPFPNGIELSPDGRSVYVNVYLAGQVRRIDRESGELLGAAEVASPDNVTWSADGSRLLVASHTGSLRDMMPCMDLEEGSCPMPFEIVALDPESMARTTLLARRGAPMGGATVALQVGDDLWLGTFAGDRVARVPGAASAD